MYSENRIKLRKKLIEVAIPLEVINEASTKEKSIRHGHPNTLHLWWAPRPLSAARAILFCQTVDDPSACPEDFPSKQEQDEERKRLFDLVSKIVTWENSFKGKLIDEAREEIRKSWNRCCVDNANHPKSKQLFNPAKIPDFHDPFAGGGAIPLEAQRLGFNSFASDLNPISVLINKAKIEIPYKFSNKKPINNNEINNLETNFKGCSGLAQDVSFYGNWLRNEVKKELRNFYPDLTIDHDLTCSESNLESAKGTKYKVIAWIWARTIKSPSPSFNSIYVPLVSTFVLSSKPGKEVFIKPKIIKNYYTFEVKSEKSNDYAIAKNGTKYGKGSNFKCLLSGDLISPKYIKNESMNGRLRKRLLAIVVAGPNGRIFFSPNKYHEEIALSCIPKWKLTENMNRKSKDLVSGRGYGFLTWSDLFTERQLLCLTTFSELIKKTNKKIVNDAISVFKDESFSLEYANAITTYLAIAINKVADYNSSLVIWSPSRSQAKTTFSRQALPMVWDFAEVNPFAESAGDFSISIKGICRVLRNMCSTDKAGNVSQANATIQLISENKIVSTDPPYYDNICYSDLSDFFYVWVKRNLNFIYPELFKTILVPKSDEIVATSYRHPNKIEAKKFFLNGMSAAISQIADHSHPAFPITIYYAFKQSESKSDIGLESTGWETFLNAVINSGLSIEGTWPIRTEREKRSLSIGNNALASSVILVCRKRRVSEKLLSRKDLRRKLRNEIPLFLNELEKTNIAPVDIAQAAIGPGISIYSKAKAILNPDDSKMSVREALIEINSALDEYLSKDDLKLDMDTSFALTFFESFGYSERPFGDAEGLAKARNVSVEGIVRAGILKSVGGKVNLIKRKNLPQDWDPLKDDRLCIWEATQYLIRTLETEGELGASKLLYKLKNIFGKGDLTSNCRSLAYRLYNHCEKNKKADEARSYNNLITSWPELEKLSYEKSKSFVSQKEIF